MKQKIFSVFLIVAVLLTTFNFWTSPQSAKENSEVANLALMLPESDIIVAFDMDKTLNVVGPNLLSQDAKKIENLKKLMKSLENVIGLNPYEVRQIVAGVKLPAVEEKNFLEKIDYTIIFRTARSNNTILEDWSKKIDAIEAFNEEKEPTEEYMDVFKRFRYYKITKEETEKIGKLNKEFEEILKKSEMVELLLNGMSKTAKLNKLHKDSSKKNKAIVDAVNRCQLLLKNDAEVKPFRDASIKLQNRWYEVSLEDAKRGEKLAEILKEAKTLFPNYKAKMENLVKIDALINLSNYYFYEQLAKKSFGIQNEENDYQKSPNEMMKEKLDETVKILTNSGNSTTQLKTVSRNLQRLEEAMKIRLKQADEAEKFEDLTPEEKTPTKSDYSLAKSIKDNAKISAVNGKRMITIDYEKISFWNPAIETVENKEITDKEAKPGETKTEVSQTKIEVAKEKKDEPSKDKKDDKKEEKKKELFAIGYLDDKTMVIGFETGIRAILNRNSDYKNPKAAEMLNSFKNPLISFATNSKIFQNFLRDFERPEAKKEEKKITPSDKFFKDLNMFGAIEFDGDSEATSDLMMSLGFTKNKVEDVFSIEADEEESSVFEVGDYQISKAIFYDLLNTLKAFKASISFKFEKKKVAALIESTPQIIEDIRASRTKRKFKSEPKAKTKVKSLQNIEELLTSPKFYTDLFGVFGKLN